MCFYEVYATAATNGKDNAVMITNVDCRDHTIKTNLTGNVEAYLIDKDNLMEKVEINASEFDLKENQVIFIKTK